MNKIFPIIFIFVSLFARNEKFWDFQHTFATKKDQNVQLKVLKDYKKTFLHEGDLTFRWTLFHNNRLVLLVDYEGFKTQYVLMHKYGRDSIKINLTGDYKRVDLRAFLIVKFLAFDIARKEAKIKIFLRDPAKRLEIKIISPK